MHGLMEFGVWDEQDSGTAEAEKNWQPFKRESLKLRCETPLCFTIRPGYLPKREINNQLISITFHKIRNKEQYCKCLLIIKYVIQFITFNLICYFGRSLTRANNKKIDDSDSDSKIVTRESRPSPSQLLAEKAILAAALDLASFRNAVSTS